MEGTAAMNVNDPPTHDGDGRLTLFGLAKELRTVMGFPADFTNENAAEFISNLDNRATPGTGYFAHMFQKIQNARMNFRSMSLRQIGEGTYGKVYGYSAANGTEHAIKSQILQINRGTSDETADVIYRDFFTESLIQILLSNDRVVGQNIPKIHSIWRDGNTKVYTDMQKISGITIDKFLDNQGPRISFNICGELLSGFAKLKNELYNRYRFVHLDFRLGNIAIAEDEVPIIFDFGTSCIEFGGLKIRGQSFMRSDIRTSECNPTADLALLVSNINLYYYDRLDNKGKRLMNYLMNTRLGNPTDQILAAIPDNRRLLPQSVNSIISAVARNRSSNTPLKVIRNTARNLARESREQLGRSHYFHGSYNYYNNKFAAFDQFLPENLVRIIEALNNQAGGRRRRNTRRNRRQ